MGRLGARCQQHQERCDRDPERDDHREGESPAELGAPRDATAKDGPSSLQLGRDREGGDPRDAPLEQADLVGVRALGREEHALAGCLTAGHPLVVPVDRSRIRQLALNLIENAVKYTPRGGQVSVELGSHDGRVVFSVADTGIGIAPGDLPHVFDRFWRADSARTRTSERAGTGLGLAICKWIAEAHGGTIDVQSRPGRGTTFTVGLPRG